MMHELIYHLMAEPVTDGANNKDVLIALLSFLGIAVTGIVSFAIARFNAKSATKASSEGVVTPKGDHVTAIDAANRQVDVNEWKELVGSLQAEVKRLATRVDDLEKKDDANRVRIESLEAAVRTSDTKYHMALTYIRDVVQWTKALLVTHRLPDVAPPEPPAEIAADMIHL